MESAERMLPFATRNFTNNRFGAKLVSLVQSNVTVSPSVSLAGVPLLHCIFLLHPTLR
jgi:hypothetical protein